MDNLPTYKITIDDDYAEGEDLGVDSIAFTAKPAILQRGFAFSSDSKLMMFKDEVKMRIAAPAMIPMEIYRNDEMGEYYVQFTESEIERIFSKFMKNLNNVNKFNLEHSQNDKAPAYILEAWLVGEKNLQDRSYSEFGIEVPQGTLFIVAQVTDKDYYTMLVENGQTGFSIEGFLGMKFSDLQTKHKHNMQDNLMLPDGEHTIGDKVYVVKDGQVTEIKDVVAAAEVEVEVETPEDNCETETPEVPETPEVTETPETPAETPVVPTQMAIDQAELMSILQPKFDELYGVIADLKAQLEAQGTATETPSETPTMMSVHHRYSEAMKFLK